ncbi:unnamed protein product [Rotaria sordida]|uniref:Ionotropic glutamate receptor C-terminal domain-containing protein n=1 Tax=Rotaria sordida TaxID=392033 RepID=A0A818XBF0_9BILA|nr:unnamed protein product [Rotaria sordida]CAF3735050.1 unnamed protein product [Rotaria sordida]CAF3902432.1 unnamed protein product [Rotaria sordida]
MITWWNYQWLLFYFIFGQLNVYYVTSAWPSLNVSKIQLLGLFDNISNTSESNKLCVHSRAMFKAAILLSQKYNIRIEEQLIGWQSAETDGDIIDPLSKTCQILSYSNIVGIVGPGLSREAHLLAAFGKRIGIPVISYSVTDPDLSDRNAYPSFFRTVPSDNSTALAIVKLFIRFNWTSCIIIYQNDAFGSGAAKVIHELFINHDLLVEEFIIFDVATLHIRGDLKTFLMNSVARIVILWVQSDYIHSILNDALKYNVLGPHFTWILSSSISLDNFDKIFQNNLIGLLTIEPVTASIVNAPINTTLLDEAYQIWQQYEPESFPGSTKVDFYALFAFDATWSLIQSLEKFCSTLKNNSSSCLSFTESSFCFHRRFVHSDLLLNTLSRTDFLGVSGPIKFTVDGTDRINGSYYYVQNVQRCSNELNFVPVLEYSDSNNWKMFQDTNVIIWPGNSLVCPSGRATLKGRSLRIGVIESIPFTMVINIVDKFGQNKKELIGYIPELIELLQDRIGFISNITLASSNQTYSGLIQSVANGDYDIVVGDVTETSIRRELVSFSNAIFDNSLHIVMRKTPDINIDLLSFLKSFSFNLWLLVLCAIIYAGLLICLLERNDNEILKNRSKLSQLIMSIWYSFGNLVGYGVDFHVNTAAGRLVTASLYILSLILVATFTANLASNLTILKSKNFISGIDDIKKGKIPFNRIGLRAGTASEDYYLREISGDTRSYYAFETVQELFNNLLNGIVDAIIIDTSIAEYITNNIYCNLTIVGEEFDKGVYGIVSKKYWFYNEDLDVNILSLRESGELEDLRRKWFQRQGCPNLYETSTEMGINSMSGLFLIFAIITILSLLLFIWTKRYIVKKYLSKFLHRRKFIIPK